MALRFRLSLVVLLSLIPLAAVSAPMALVGDEEGHAILVSHRGNCYAVMPDHVAARERMALVTALPQTTGLAHVFHRVPEMDIALAYVEGDLLSQCEQSWPDLARDLNPVFATSAAGGLSRIQFNGQFIDRAEATIVDIDETHFEIVTSDQWANSEIMSGVSGALFYVNGVPVGIALSAENTSRARFLRLDRVFAVLDKILNKSGASHPASLQISGAELGLGYHITSQVRMRNGARIGLKESLAAKWDGEQIELVFTLSNNLPVPLTRITMQTAATDQTVTFPQKIKLELDVGGPDRPFWRELFAADMSPSGLLEINTGQTVARRVRISIRSVWHPDRPMRIDRVVFQ